MKAILVVIIFFLFLPSISYSQAFTLDSTAYRQSVFSKTKDVFDAVGIQQNEQAALADLFTNEEDSIANAIGDNKTDDDLVALENQIIVQFQTILSASELILYRQNRPFSLYSREVAIQGQP